MSFMKAAFRVVLVACCVAALIQAATLARYPYVQNVRGDRATIVWTTLESGPGVVQYATDRGFSCTTCFIPARIREFLPSETGLVFPFYQYEAEITGLRPATDYFYRVTADGQNLTAGDDLRFRTAGSNPFTFLVIADTGQGTRAQIQIAARMMAETPAPALVLHAGDIAYGAGRFEDFQQRHFDIYRDLMKLVPFFPAPGNHEYDTNSAAPYLAMHSLPTEDVPIADRGRYYSFDWTNVHFIALDSNLPLENAAKGTGPMLQWLERDLQKTRKYWRIAYFHHPPYASGSNEGDPLEALARDFIVPILERYDVQLVLNGHEHSYRRTYSLRNSVRVPDGQGTVYITAGGGGASLYPVSSDNTNPRCCPDVTAYAESAYHYLRGEVDGTRIIVRAFRHCEPPRTGCSNGEMDVIRLEPPPEISAEATVNAASYTTALAPGALISIFGRNLALEERLAPGLPLPFEMSRIGLTLNSSRLPLLYVSPSQINAQLPFDVQGRATLRLATPNSPSPVEIVVNIAPTAPAIFTMPTQFGILPAVVHANGTLVTPASPAEAGEFIAVFLTGLGQVDGPLLAGQPAPRSPLLRARAPVDARVGNVVVAPVFAGLAPDFAGLYQVNLQVPGVPSGPHSLRIVAGGVSSNAVNLAVRSTSPEPEPPGSGSSIGRSLITPESLIKKPR